MLHRSISYSLIFGLSAVALAVLLFAVGSATDAGAQTAPGLGAASSFAVLGGTTVTNTGPTTIGGDIGVSPGSAITGQASITLTGATHAGDAVALQAQNDVTSAYNALTSEPCTGTNVALSGATLTPGVYCFTSSALLTGTLTLNGAGVYIFTTVSTLTTAVGSTVALIGGAQPCNVFWQIGSSADLFTNTTFVGNILALTSINLRNGASVSGRALARNGAVTMDTNHVASSGCAASTATASPTTPPTATAAPTDTPTATATPTAAATPAPTATPVGQTPTPTATPVGQTPTPTPTATPFGQTPTPVITPCCLPNTGTPSSQGPQVPWALLLAGLVATGLGASALVLGARARRRDAQQSGR